VNYKEASVIHSGCFHSSSSGPLLLRGTPGYMINSVSELTCRSNRQLRIKDLPMVPMWRL